MVGRHGEPGAVERIRPRRSPHVGFAQLILCEVHGDLRGLAGGPKVPRRRDFGWGWGVVVEVDLLLGGCQRVQQGVEPVGLLLDVDALGGERIVCGLRTGQGCACLLFCCFGCFPRFVDLGGEVREASGDHVVRGQGVEVGLFVFVV